MDRVGLERRLLAVLALFLIIIMTGTLGYKAIEGWIWLDSAYMSVLTVTTVGFAEVQPLSTAGRAFTMVMMVLGIGGIAYAASAIGEYVVGGQLADIVGERRMRNRIGRLRNHVIVCGFGRAGEEATAVLRREGEALVIVDPDPATIERAGEEGHLVLLGSAGDDAVLLSAGLGHAKGVVVAAAPDAEALMAVLSARALNPDVPIVARASYQETESKLLAAGASRVISPYSIGGRRMAQLVLRPAVVDFLDVVMQDESTELRLEDFALGYDGPLIGVSIEESGILETCCTAIVGLRKQSGVTVAVPAGDTRFEAGDVLMALGTRSQLDALRARLQ